MIYESTQPAKIRKDTFKEYYDLPEILTDAEVKYYLGKFLKENLKFTWELLTQQKLYPFQEIIINGWFQKDNSLFVAARGASKCLDKDGVVLTASGFKKIIDTEVGEYIYTGENTFKEILAKEINPEEDGFEVKTAKGFKFRGKRGHKSLIFNPDTLDFEYKEIEEINKGDIMPIKFGMNHYNNCDLSLDLDLIKRCGAKNFNLNINEDLYYLLGLIFGDGCTRLGGNAFSISSEERETADFIHAVSKILFPQTKVCEYTKPNNKATDYVIGNGLFLQFLRQIGVDTDAKAHEKEIPNSIINSKKEYIAAFLQGLFDTDGYITVRETAKKNATTGTVGFSSSSLSMVETVRRLLLNFGVVASIHLHRKAGKAIVCGQECMIQNSYAVHIGGRKFVKLFAEQIGFRLSRKKNALTFALNATSKIRDYNSNLIPIGAYLKKKYKDSCFRKYNIHKIYPNISEERVKEMLEFDFIDEADKLKLRNLLQNWHFVKVKDLLPIKTISVDIQVDKDECYWSDGFIHHNSYMISVFALLFAIFNPKSRIVVVANNFRTVKNIFMKMEEFLEDKNNVLLKQAFPRNVLKLPDQVTIFCGNGSSIVGLPLSGENLRGQRATVLIVDEALLVSKTMLETVLGPFLNSNLNLDEQKEIENVETQLISMGSMKEEDRTVFSKNKMVLCSSASYKFEYLYEGIYEPYVAATQAHNGDPKTPNYYITRLSYHIPAEAGIILDSAIKAAIDAGREFDQNFQRESMALFSDTSGNFFNVRKIKESVVPDLDYPCVCIKGEKNEEYLVSIDPSYSSAENSDFFGLSVFLLNKSERKITQVFVYGLAGGDIKKHYEMLTYVLENFNVVSLVIDNTGSCSVFLRDYCESQLAKSKNIKLEFIDADFEADGDGYVQELKKAKGQWNVFERRFVTPFTFSSHTIRKANEFMQGQINAKKVWFASRLTSNHKEFAKVKNWKMPYEFVDKYNKKFENELEFFEHLDDWQEEVQNQLAMIQVTATSSGNLQFDLPPYCRRDTGQFRARKDQYSCMLMAVYTARIYFDMLDLQMEKPQNTFIPFWI